MSFVLRPRLLAGLLLSAWGWATLGLARPFQDGKPAPDALATAGRFTQLCETKLKLAPEQAAALHTYLDQEITYLTVLAANGIAAETPGPAAAEADQLNQVLARLLSPAQLRDFGKLRQTPQAQAYLRSMALLAPAPADQVAKTKRRQRHNSELVAQRLDEAD